MELYIVASDAQETKAIFDALAAHRDAIESAFGAALNWQRLDDKRASRISFGFDGGWGDEAVWPRLIETATDAMGRLFDAVGARLQAVEAQRAQG